jgi:hypothetical protein
MQVPSENLPQILVQSRLVYLQESQRFTGWDWAIWIQTVVFTQCLQEPLREVTCNISPSDKAFENSTKDGGIDPRNPGENIKKVHGRPYVKKVIFTFLAHVP